MNFGFSILDKTKRKFLNCDKDNTLSIWIRCLTSRSYNRESTICRVLIFGP